MIKKLLSSAGLCAALLASGTPADAAPPANDRASQPSVAVDTDMGFDDWLGLYLVARTRDLAFVSIAATGETYCEAGRKNAAYILELAGVRKVPIACGRSEPVNGYGTFPTPWRVEASEMTGRTTAQRDIAVAPSEPADRALAQLLKRSLRPIDLLALGPLTNIADLLQLDPHAATRIAALYIMGGAVDVPGNIRVPGVTDSSRNTVSEWNLYVDPAAAGIVMRAPLHRRLVPLDATRDAPLNQAFLDRLAKIDTPAARFFLRVYSSMQQPIADGQLYFWDAAAAMCMIDSGLCRRRDEPLIVVQAFADPACPALNDRCPYEEATAGALRREPGVPTTTIAYAIDGPRMMDEILEILARR